VSNFPIASDARLAGDAKQTRFVLDLDKPIQFRAFALADPYRVVLDLPQVSFKLGAGTGVAGRGLVKAFRYGLVMPGGSRIVFDLTGPAKIAKSYVLEAANGQPPRLVPEFEEVDRTAFVQLLAPGVVPNCGPRRMPAGAANAGVAQPDASIVTASTQPPDKRPVIVIDPGHGGVDNGTQAGGGDIMEKNLVLGFGLALRDKIEKSGKYRVVMTRTDDTFIPLNERVKIARNESASLFVSIHADALPRGEGDAQGQPSIRCRTRPPTPRRSGADAENKSDASSVNLTTADRGRRHPDRSGAAGDAYLFKPFRADLDGRNEEYGTNAQASAEIGGLPGPEGAGCALGPG
jgi:N-acetylmuramoyl-L-alanine amidase